MMEGERDCMFYMTLCPDDNLCPMSCTLGMRGWSWRTYMYGWMLHQSW